jgi:hypothetical protein
MPPPLADRLRELIARHASLQRQTCTCKHCLYLEEAATALDRTEALEQALRRYGQHEPACWAQTEVDDGNPYDCICGLAAALSGGDPQ